MRLVAINRVPADAVLARDVLVGRSDGIPLLRKGVKLNDRFLRGLQQTGIHAIYIDDRLSEGIMVQHALSDEVRSQTTRAVAVAYESAKQTIVTGQPYSERTLTALSSRRRADPARARADRPGARSRSPTCAAPTPTRSSTRST